GVMGEGKVVAGVEVALEHARPVIVKRMRRPVAQEKTLKRIASWRQLCPQLTIRSTFIVGFPGETDDEFAQLLDWLSAAELDRVGCFRYEPVSGAVANDVAAAVPDAAKEKRSHSPRPPRHGTSRKRLKRDTVASANTPH